MELTQIQNTNSLMTTIDVKNTSNIDSLQNIQNNTSKYPSDKVVIEKNNDSKSFLSSNVSPNLLRIAELQKQQSQVSSQMELTSRIVKVTQNAIQSDELKIDDQQPKIKNIMDNFNKLSENSKRPEISDKPGIYFDGKVGARPLSTKEIFDDIQVKQDRLSEIQQFISNEITTIAAETKNSFENEKTKIEIKVEFKKINFENESLQFKSSFTNDFNGSIISSQANALPSNSEKLLA